MTGFKIPLDAYVVSIPTIYACCALTGLVIKTLSTDPEMSTAKYYEGDEAKVAKDAMNWNDSVQDLFRKRINNHKTGVFTNWFEGTRQ